MNCNLLRKLSASCGVAVVTLKYHELGQLVREPQEPLGKHREPWFDKPGPSVESEQMEELT